MSGKTIVPFCTSGSSGGASSSAVEAWVKGLGLTLTPGAYSNLQNSRQKRRGGQIAQGKAEDAGGLTPVKDDNAAMR